MADGAEEIDAVLLHGFGGVESVVPEARRSSCWKVTRGLRNEAASGSDLNRSYGVATSFCR